MKRDDGYSSDWTGWDPDPLTILPDDPSGDLDEGESLWAMLLAAVVIGISIGVLIVWYLR